MVHARLQGLVSGQIYRVDRKFAASTTQSSDASKGPGLGVRGGSMGQFMRDMGRVSPPDAS